MNTRSDLSRFNWSFVVAVLLVLTGVYVLMLHVPKTAIIIISAENIPRMRAFAYLDFVTWVLTLVFGLISIFSFGGFTTPKRTITWNQYQYLLRVILVSDALLAGLAFLIHFPLFVWVAQPLVVQTALILCQILLLRKQYFPES